jgi:hypothetical protein
MMKRRRRSEGQRREGREMIFRPLRTLCARTSRVASTVHAGFDTSTGDPEVSAMMVWYLFPVSYTYMLVLAGSY